jgi:hypothetical protein
MEDIIVRMAIAHQVDLQMRAIPIKIGTAFEKEIYKMILKFI